MAVKKKAESGGWDDVPKQGEKFPNMYAIVHIDSHDIGDRGGLALWKLEGRIVEGPEEYIDNPVFLNFKVGTEDDPDGSDPASWTSREAIQKGQNYDVQSFAEIAKALKVKSGPGDPDVLDEIDDEDIGVTFGTRVSKKDGSIWQTYRFWAKGERKPGLIGAEDKTGGRAAGKTKRHEDEDDEDEEESPKKKSKR